MSDYTYSLEDENMGNGSSTQAAKQTGYLRKMISTDEDRDFDDDGNELKESRTSSRKSSSATPLNPRTADDEGDERLIRTRPRSIWKYLLLLVGIFVVLVGFIGLRCALDMQCKTELNPSLGVFLNNTETSRLATTAIDTLVVIHFGLTVAIKQLIHDHTMITVVFMILASVGMYVSIFLSLNLIYWYVGICPVIMSVLWAIIVTHGLRLYYRYKKGKRLYYCTVIALTLYIIGAGLYLVFSAIPAVPDFAGKQTGVFASQIILLASGLLFVILLVFHIRKVSVIYQSERPLESYGQLS